MTLMNPFLCETHSTDPEWKLCDTATGLFGENGTGSVRVQFSTMTLGYCVMIVSSARIGSMQRRKLLVTRSVLQDTPV